MKKLFYLLFLLPLAFLASCDNDNDLPEVDLTITLSNVYQENNSKFYYVADDETPLVIDGIKATPLAGGNQAAVVNAFYTLNNGRPLFITEEDSNKPIVPAQYFVEGYNRINVSANVLQVDKSIAECYFEVPVTVVASETDLPDGIGQMGTYSVTMKMSKNK